MSERARSLTVCDIVLTYIDVAGRWKPLHLVRESPWLPGQLGFFLCWTAVAGETVGYMRDGRPIGTYAPGSKALRLAAQDAAEERGGTYLYTLRGRTARQCTLLDGIDCRDGGPKRANDARGLGARNNAVVYEDGGGSVLQEPGRAIEAVRADMSAAQLRKAEVLWHYGDEYWEGVEH